MNYGHRALNKLSRLDRVDGEGKGLATNDPLLAEILIANTLAQLDTAEAIRDQTAFLKSLPIYHPHYGDYFEKQRTVEFQRKSLDLGLAVVRTLETISTTIKDIFKLMRHNS